MRVLLFTDNHIPSGGTEKYFFELKNRLKNTPDIQVYSMGFGPQPTNGQDYFVLKAPQSRLAQLCWRIFPNPFIYFKLRKQLKKIQPDVIHIHNMRQYTPSVLQAMKPYPIIQTMHDFSGICPMAQNIHRDHAPCPTGITMKCFWQHQIKYNRLIYLILTAAFYRIQRQLKKYVKQFIAPSPFLADYLKRKHFQAAIAVLPFKREATDYSFENMKPNHFLFAGNLGTHKGVHLLIEEFALACQTNTSLVLHIAGTGPEENKLRMRIRELGLEKNIHFLGWKENLDTCYQQCTAVIFPSIGLESFGLVTTEAMSHARPVIGVNRGTTAWLIQDEQTGLLFDPLKRGDLAEKILRIASDLKLVQKLGKNGFERLHGLIDNEASLQQMISLYQHCISD